MTTYSIISIDYDMYQPGSYRRTYLRLGDGSFEFTSGSPNIDYNRAITVSFKRGYLPLMHNSVDAFMQDGGELERD